MAFKIGNITIEKKVILAPMAGVTSFSYRNYYDGFKGLLKYTEMISDCGLIYDNKETNSLIYTDGNEHPLALQLFGGDINNIIKAIKILESKNIDYDILDINLACPVKKVTKTGAGSALLVDQDKLYNFMKTVCETSSKPVSCKVRLGYEEINIEQTVVTLEKAGVKFIAIHARTMKDLYSGTPKFEELKNIRDLIKIPFAISGNIYSVNDALEALKVTRADAVLVARGAIGNPKLVKNILDAIEGIDYNEELNFDEQCKYLLDFTNMLIKEKNEKRAISILRGIAPRFFTNFPNSKQLRINLAQNMNSYNDLINFINSYKDSSSSK